MEDMARPCSRMVAAVLADSSPSQEEEEAASPEASADFDRRVIEICSRTSLEHNLS